MMNIYSVYDRVAQEYSLPFFCGDSPDHGIAVRIFSQAIKPGTMLYDAPDDYCLVYLGEFDTVDGKFDEQYDSAHYHEVVIQAADIKRKLVSMNMEESDEVQK